MSEDVQHSVNDDHHHHSSTPADRIIVRPLPKFVILWPTMIIALIAGFMGSAGYNMAFAFLLTLFINYLILAFDFDRVTTIAIVAIIAAVLLAMKNFGIVIGIKEILDKFHPEVAPPFYFGFAFMMFVIYVWVFIDTRFDYWEISPNEILHHHGFLGDVERFPAPNLSMKKEIHDVFEYLLLGSGRLIFYPSGKDRPVILDNVMRINAVEERVKKILDSLSVKIR